LTIVPGRIGCQCSNFYQQIIAAGEINDSSYTQGTDGKLHHVNYSDSFKVVASFQVVAPFLVR
jgi:hypothetical protein